MNSAAIGATHALKMPPLRFYVHAALVVGALLLTCGLHAAGLFLPVDAATNVGPAAKSMSARQSASGGTDAWERRVRIHRHELTTARDDVKFAGTGRLLLNVKDGVRLDVIVERTAPTRFGYSLSGRVTGDALGFVTLVVHDAAVAGSIWTPDSEYELRYVGRDVHALRDVTNAPPLACGGALPSELPVKDTTARIGGRDDGSVVDILVVWSPTAEEDAGGKPQVLSAIEMLIAYTNDVLERSGAFVSLSLVGTEKVDFEVDLNALSSAISNSGVRTRRDALGADLVAFVYGGEYRGGIAFGAFSFAPLRGGGTFAHEVGHNFGIGHERHEFTSDRSPIPRSYQYGFSTKSCEVSINSYGTECRTRLRSQPFYASPWRYGFHSGNALGVTRFSKKRGARGPADAVLTINRARHHVANLRPSRKGE